MTTEPDTRTGRFGDFGGQFVPETLMPALGALEAAWNEAAADEAFRGELGTILREYVGRSTALTYAERLSDELGGARIYLKREDLAHTGAHKINNALGQVLLAQRLRREGGMPCGGGPGRHQVASAGGGRI